jgi:PAS domain S-box-containing protein
MADFGSPAKAAGGETGNAETGCIEAAILENAMEIIVVLEPSGKVLTWNQAAENVTGYPKAEVIGTASVWKRLYPDKDYRDTVTARIGSILEMKDSSENFETTISTQSGEKRTIFWSARAIGEGGRARIVTVGRDLTELRELDAFRESIIENANDLVTVLDSKGTVLVWNRAAESITGYSRDEVVGSREIWKQLYPDAGYRSNITGRIADILATKQYFENFETRIVTRGGETRRISWNTREIRAGGKSRAIAIGRDITEIAKAKQDIKESAEFRNSVIENAKLWLTFLDDNNQVIIWNRAAEDISGYSRDEVIGHDAVWKWLYPDDSYRREVTREIVDRIASRRYLENFETDIRTKSGETRRISWNTREMAGDAGESRGYIVAGTDITELRRAEAFREGIIENANVLIAVLDLAGSILLWNVAAEEITGFTRDETVGSAGIWRRLYPDKEYRDGITRQITGVISDRKEFSNLETRITTKSGERKTLLWNTRQIAFGGTHQLISIGIDVTREREAEEALTAYMTEMAMRIKQPVENIHEYLADVAQLIRDAKISPEETVVLLDGQIRNAARISQNVQEFQKAIVEKSRAIPDAYRTFLEGD